MNKAMGLSTWCSHFDYNVDYTINEILWQDIIMAFICNDFKNHYHVTTMLKIVNVMFMSTKLEVKIERHCNHDNALHTKF